MGMSFMEMIQVPDLECGKLHLNHYKKSRLMTERRIDRFRTMSSRITRETYRKLDAIYSPSGRI